MQTDPNETVNRLAAKMAEHEEALPPDIEAAWEKWINSIQRVDERTKTLLRAAFEVGVAVATSQALK